MSIPENAPPVVSPQEWDAARQKLLVKEKRLTRARDAGRRAPPDALDGGGEGVRLRGPGRVGEPARPVRGRRQLIVYRFFFEPGVAGWPEGGCVGCSMMADQVAHLAHLNAWHGTNAFRREGDRIFRTYLIDSRGDEGLGSVWSYLDMTALGRQEAWEDSPEGYPQTEPYRWWRLHDEYGDHDRPVRNGRNEELRPTIDEHAGGAAG